MITKADERLRQKQFRQEHPEKANAYHRRQRARRRWQVLNHYSNETLTCACCGEDIYEFLTIDHVNGDGAAHRREIGSDIMRWLIANDFPEGFQILCYNCNCVKGKRGGAGVCPHQAIVAGAYRSPDPADFAPRQRIFPPLIYQGRTQSIAAWAEETGVSANTLRNRIRNGWDTERVLTTPVRFKGRQLIYQGRAQSIAAWAEETGISANALRVRIARGWDIERALTTPVRSKSV